MTKRSRLKKRLTVADRRSLLRELTISKRMLDANTKTLLNLKKMPLFSISLAKSLKRGIEENKRIASDIAEFRKEVAGAEYA